MLRCKWQRNSLRWTCSDTQQQTQPALALSVPLRGSRRESPVAQFLVVRRFLAPRVNESHK